MRNILTIFVLLLAGNLFAQEGMFILASPIFPDRERAVSFLYAGKDIGFHFGINAGRAKGQEKANTFNDVPFDELLQDTLLALDNDADGVAIGLSVRMIKNIILFGGVDFIDYKVYEKYRDLDGNRNGGEYFVYRRVFDFKRSYGYFGALAQFGFIGLQAAYYPKTKEVLAGVGISLDLIR